MTTESAGCEQAAPIEVRWPGVVVVGGGATGLLTALELDQRGIPAVVIEQGFLCSGQTGQCHGWLHRGTVFPDASAADVSELDRGARRWARLAPRSGAAITCQLAGVHEETRTSVIAAWDRLGLGHQSATVLGGGPRWLVEGPELAIVPRDVLKRILVDSTVALRCARAIELRQRAGTDAAGQLRVVAGDRVLHLSADAFVVAGGTGLDALLPDLSGLLRRLSFMLVIRSAAVGEKGIAIPEQEALGLFAVPRTDGDRRFLLVSNFMSYSPATELRHVRTSWLRGIGATFSRFLPELWQADDARWGVYGAIKIEPARDLALGVPRAQLLPTRYANVVAGVPGKLTVAPLLAERLAAAVAPFAARSRQAQAADALPPELPPAVWGPEEWQVTPLVRRETLFGGVHGP
jgi:hypothetical protein